MAHRLGNLLGESSTSTGTGALTLAGARTGYLALSTVCGNGDTFFYSIRNGAEVEVGLATYSTTGPSITRTTVFTSSNSNNAVNFSAGTKLIDLVEPTEQVLSTGFAGTDNTGGATITMGTGDSFNLITSTTAITAFAFTVDWIGRKAIIRFNTARTLTHNGTSLIIPGAANVTTAQGDIALIESLGSGNFRVNFYQRANGRALIEQTAGLTGVLRSDSGVVSVDTDVTDIVTAASDTAQGKVELATTTEALTGTDTARAVTPDALAAIWEGGTDNTGGATITMGEGASFNLITSTTAITAFAFTTDKVGRKATIRFNTVRTLTHNGTSLIIPGGASLTTAAGDVCEIQSLGSGNFRVNYYSKASGLATVPDTISTSDNSVVVNAGTRSLDFFDGTATTAVITNPGGSTTNVVFNANTSSTSNTLTGLSTTTLVTPDSLAALWEAGTDNTGGATITMGDGGLFNLITSTTAITAFAFTDDKAGRSAIVRFATARTLTYNATSLILPSAANITTVAGDIALIQSLGSGNFRVNVYQRADGTALINPACEAGRMLGTPITGSTAAAVPLTGVQQGQNFRMGPAQTLTPAAGANTSSTMIVNVEAKIISFDVVAGVCELHGLAQTGGNSGGFLYIRHASVSGSLVIKNQSGTEATQANRLATPNGVDFTISQPTGGVFLVNPSNGWRVVHPFTSAIPLATTTEVLTGTDTADAVTPDALAALWEAGTDNTGGATITMGEGGSFNLITSTTAITAFAFTTDKAGRCAIIRFNTARTLTHNATSLIIPGGANITTAQGDICQIQSLGSGNFRVNFYQRANGTPIILNTAADYTWTGDHYYQAEYGPYVAEQVVAGSGPHDVTITPGTNRVTFSGTSVTVNSITGGTLLGHDVLVYFSGTGTHTVNHQGLGVGNEANIFLPGEVNTNFGHRGSFLMQANGAAGWRAHSLTNVATTTQSGSVELATTAEVLAGTDAARAVTPDALAALWEAGTDNTGGATITMGDGGSFNLITSSATITAFAFTTDKVGRKATIRFNTARTVTHNATSLILPSGASFNAAIGDIAEIESLGSGNFRVNNIQHYATQTDQEAGSHPLAIVTSAVQHLHLSAVKCFGFTTGAGSPVLHANSYNVTSITNTATGRLTVTIGNDFSSANWCGTCTATCTTNANRMTALVSKAAGSVILESSSATTTLAAPGVGWDWQFTGDL